MGSMQVHCAHDGLVPIDELQPHPKNRNNHPPEQIDRLAAILRYQGFRYPIKVSRLSGFITSGHGRLEAARLNGWAHVPVSYQEYESEEQEYADLTADNAIASWSELDLSGINADLGDLGPDFDIDMLGLKDFVLEPSEKDLSESNNGSLQDRFGVPPFSVLDTKQGYWQERRREWLSIGMQSELGREAKSYQIGDWVRSKMAAGSIVDSGGLNSKSIGNGTSVFDPVLCELMYLWFSTAGDTVVDPFAGGSVRGIVASKLGRQYVGIELRDEQVDANRAQEGVANQDRVPVWIKGDSLDMPILIKDVKADMIMSCPPYADLEVYSDDARDLSNMGYSDFIGAYRKIIKNCYDILNNDRFACFVIGEVRSSKGSYYNFLGDTIDAFTSAGFSYYNEAVLLNQVGSAAIRADKQMQASRKLVKLHQNVLVFCKGDPKKATQRMGDVFIPEMPDELAESAHDL
jgi:DNA modification methylase